MREGERAKPEELCNSGHERIGAKKEESLKAIIIELNVTINLLFCLFLWDKQ